LTKYINGSIIQKDSLRVFLANQTQHQEVMMELPLPTKGMLYAILNIFLGAVCSGIFGGAVTASIEHSSLATAWPGLLFLLVIAASALWRGIYDFMVMVYV
jgi:hypothetical protein